MFLAPWCIYYFAYFACRSTRDTILRTPLHSQGWPRSFGLLPRQHDAEQGLLAKLIAVNGPIWSLGSNSFFFLLNSAFLQPAKTNGGYKKCRLKRQILLSKTTPPLYSYHRHFLQRGFHKWFTETHSSKAPCGPTVLICASQDWPIKSRSHRSS